MRKLIISLLFISGLYTTATLAQSEHGHSHGPTISDAEAKLAASNMVETLAADGKIDSRWTTTEAASVSQRVFDGHLEWVVTYQNDTIEEQDKRTLYIFMTLGGKYKGANYTGE